MHRLAGPVEVGRKAASLLSELAREAAGPKGKFSVALSGGSTPERLFELLASDEYRISIPWASMDVFWADERCVPPEDERSNFRLAYETFLQNVPAKTHRIRGELGPERAAELYEKELREFFGLEGAHSMPRFDVIFLGLGADGHTASLFPGSEAIGEKYRLAAPVHDVEPGRVTLTLPAINHAARVAFLVTGRQKAPVARHIIEEGNQRGYPAGLVQPVKGELIWVLDAEAAAQLTAKS